MNDFDFLDDESELRESPPGLFERPVVRLSHSSRNMLRSCERKYYLSRYKKLDTIEVGEAETNKNNTHLDFGTALGAGIQALLISEGDLTHALWVALRTFNFAEETPTKNVKSLVHAIHSFDSQWEYHEWDVVYFINKQGKSVPAAELSFKIILDEATGDYNCGYMDIVLRSKTTGLYTVVEIKTTGSKVSNIEPMYANSDQGVGYSVVLDSIKAESSTFHVLYLVVQFKGSNILSTWHFLPFLKTRKDRLEYLLTQQLDYQYLKSLEEIDYWPMRGNSCMAFNRPCFLYGVCNLDTMKDLPYQPPREEDDWTFVYSIEQLIQQQLDNN